MRTLGSRITKLHPVHGFAAQSAGAEVSTVELAETSN